MTYSNRLNLDRFFFALRDQPYAIVKLGDFPNYYSGSDIDVFCYDVDRIARLILSVGNWYVDQGFEIRVSTKGESQTYVDFWYDGELEFRFDLFQSLSNYERIRLKEHYVYSVIENASVVHREFDGARYPIYVPSTLDDLLLRYVEYIEWYETRPDKVKHLDYILDAVPSDSSRIGFLDKLHLYTELPGPGVASVNRVSGFTQRVSWIEADWLMPLYRILGAAAMRVRRLVGGQ